MSLCSNCAAPINPVVAIDIDGTISEYHQHLGSHIRKYFGKPLLPDGSQWDGRGNFEDFFKLTREQYHEAKLSFRQGGFKRWSPVRPGVPHLRATLQRLKETVGLEVWITTTRPWNRLDSTDPDTRFWLDEHFGVYDHLLYHEHKYLELSRILGDSERVVAVVEDLPSMWQEAEQVFNHETAYLLERPHNRHYRQMTAPRSVKDLQEFTTIVERKVVLWHQKRADSDIAS